MRFLSMIRLNENTGQVPSEQLMNDMGQLIEEMTRNGNLVSTTGLRPTKEGVRVRSRHGKLTTTEGPFMETKEVIGGYAILEASSLKEAIAWRLMRTSDNSDSGVMGTRFGICGGAPGAPLPAAPMAIIAPRSIPWEGRR